MQKIKSVGMLLLIISMCMGNALPVFATNLKLGNRGKAVKDLQQYLIYEGSYPEAIVSGYFGNYTQNAVKTFQRKYNIDPVLGIVGLKTRHKM